MLKTRVLVSVVLIPLFVGLCWLDSQTGRYAPLLFVFGVLLAVQSCRELGGLLKLSRGSTAATIAGSLVILISLWGWHVLAGEDNRSGPERHDAAHVSTVTSDELRSDDRGSIASLEALGPTMLAFACVVLGLLFLRAVVYLHPGGHGAILGSEIFVVSYVGVLLAMVAELRWTGGGRLGYLALGSLVIGAKVGDIGGYAFGRLFGKTKLAPILSPGKTRAGAIGAILTAAIVTALWLKYAAPLFDRHAVVGSWLQLLLFGAVLGLVGLIGDLCESLIKRDAGMKDASHLMPAFGGLLDLIDSILYAGPIALLFWTLWPPVW